MLPLPPTGPEALPDSRDLPPEPGTKRVLLLEDDPSFREAIRDFLAETGYAVVEAESGVEGIREILNGDFAIILCDMMMPGLPGDLFYRAVERARPPLCDRFIFMTGRRGDEITNDFIRSVGGHALLKPFSLQQLLTALGELERRRYLRAAPAPRSAEPARPLQDWTFGAPAPADSPAAAPRPAAPEFVPAEETPRLPRWFHLVTLLAVVAAAALIATWHRHAEQRHGAARAELQELETRWAAASNHLDHARADSARIDLMSSRVARVAEDSEQLYWSTALQRIVACTTPEIHLQALRVREAGLARDGSKLWTLRLAAVCAGSRLDADTFRRRIHRELERIFGQVDVQFSEMEERAATFAAAPESAEVAFTLLASIGAASAPAVEMKP